LISIKIFIEISYYHLYTYSINSSTIFILLETNLAEIAEYLTSYVTAFNILLFIGLFSPLIFIRFFLNHNSARPTLKYYLLITCLIIGTTFFYHFKKLDNHNLYGIGWNSYNEYSQMMRLYDKYGLHQPTGDFKEIH